MINSGSSNVPFKPVVLEHPESIGDGDKKRCRPGNEYYAVGSLDSAQNAPGRRQHNIAISETDKRYRGEVQRLFKTGEFAQQSVKRCVAPDLYGMQCEQPKNSDHDHARLQDTAGVVAKSRMRAAHEPHEQDQPEKVDERRDSYHQCGGCKVKPQLHG